MILKKEFVYDLVVVGNSVEAVDFAANSGTPIIYNKPQGDYLNEIVDPVGYEKKQKALFQLALAGQLVYMPDLQRIRDKSPSLVLYGRGQSTLSVAAGKVLLFEGDYFESEVVSINSDPMTKVCDLLSVRGSASSLGNFRISGPPDLQAYSYLSERIDGNKKYEDLLLVSRVKREHLSLFEYSDTANRFRVAKFLAPHHPKLKISVLGRDVFPVLSFSVTENERILDGRRIRH